ncbi:Serine phosphatase RsbU, regulator of sigma subunit [Williamwhitmania taraxaci]|uniref:Serine phosphatase RsbU, regulator of sigma subunit n=2 Tax=Williamwhitmania taraxaci TaxID=1640674 RepID=A0A1G6GZ35_9BACT|nr:Serine phosphatase RsbU, regulator of sigma subunit [Williamwhitmania taraxaci]
MKRTTNILLCFILCAFCLWTNVVFSSSQDKSLDSLVLVVSQSSLNDSGRIKSILQLSERMLKDPKRTGDVLGYLNEAVSVAREIGNDKLLCRSYDLLGIYYRDISQYDKALDFHNRSLELADKLLDKALLVKVYNNIGVLYRRMDEYSLAAFYHHKALGYAEEIGDLYGISVALNSLGNVYSINKNYEEAFEFFKRALALSRQNKNVLGEAINLNNLGEVYEFLGNQKNARIYYLASLRINQDLNNVKGMAICYNGIGNTYFLSNDFPTALAFYQKALAIDKILGDKKFIAESYINIGKTKIYLGLLDGGAQALQMGLTISKEIGAKWQIQLCYFYLSAYFEKSNNPSDALRYYQKSMAYKDSVLNEKAQRSIALLNTLYKTEKAERENQLLRKNEEIQQKELRKQRMFTVGLTVLIGMAIFLLAIGYNVLRIKRRTALELLEQTREIEGKNSELGQQQVEMQAQNDEIEKQRNSIAQKNKYLEDAYRIIEDYINKITDSIKYAEHIQKAILPPAKVVKSFFPDSFIYYRPKDIVSGDFYWFGKRDSKLFFAAADCTGHGVPGAFMSIIGYDLINRAFNEKGLSKPKEILEYLNDQIRISLRKEEDDIVLKDGMDIAFCSYDPRTGILEYSGALAPIVYVRQGKFFEIKPDSSSIGISMRKLNRTFTNHEIQLFPGDTIYLFSDGFIDQFGGLNRKKFMRGNFINALQDISNLPMDNQAAQLEDVFMEWKGLNEQIDDIMVIGLRI